MGGPISAADRAAGGGPGPPPGRWGAAGLTGRRVDRGGRRPSGGGKMGRSMSESTTHRDVAPPLHSGRTDRPCAPARALDVRSTSMHKVRILILYPDPAGLALLTSMLKSLGYIIDEATNDRMAVRLMEREDI